jgi:glycosyltransferase involved in cell wall biosynthesis
MSIVASFIVPTHNRSASVKTMLDCLQQQSYPLQNFEVIFAANGCTDNTIELINNYNAGFQLRVCVPERLGPGPARNAGAVLAQGKILIFADDDMELDENFIEAHVSTHTDENHVVIGYAPFKLEPNPGLQRRMLREWWEDKFQKLREEGHRYKYEDLTSGNFSISAALFKKANGFNLGLNCKDDYEFGYRLLKLGAEFSFAYEAKTLHGDTVTDLRRSLLRKKAEGIMDIEIKKMHPDLVTKDARFYLSQRSLFRSFLMKAIQYTPSLCDAMAHRGAALMNFFEKYNMRSQWLKMGYRLHQYWYLRGIMSCFPSYQDLYKFVFSGDISLPEDQKQKVDLLKGLKNVEEELDRTRPLAIRIYYGEKFIGSVDHESGTEPIKGVHLRKLLKDKFSDELCSVIAPDIAFSDN